jgi:hypothetical protein
MAADMRAGTTAASGAGDTRFRSRITRKMPKTANPRPAHWLPDSPKYEDSMMARLRVKSMRKRCSPYQMLKAAKTLPTRGWRFFSYQRRNAKRTSAPRKS